MMRSRTNAGMESLSGRKTSNCSNHLAALYGTMYPKRTERNIVATSYLIMAPKAASSGMFLHQHTTTTILHGKPSFNLTISPSWKRSSLRDQILVISRTKLSNDYLDQTPKDHTTKTMNQQWIQTLKRSLTSILLHLLFQQLQRRLQRLRLPMIKLSSSNLRLMQSSQYSSALWQIQYRNPSKMQCPVQTASFGGKPWSLRSWLLFKMVLGHSKT